MHAILKGIKQYIENKKKSGKILSARFPGKNLHITALWRVKLFQL
jgi:hypothetical protein